MLAFYKWVLFPIPLAAFTLLGSNTSHLQGWASMPISFFVNSSQCGIPEDRFNAAIDRALSAWNSVPTSRLRVTRGATSTVTAADVRAAGAASTVTDSPLIVCASDFESVHEPGTKDTIGGIGSMAYGSPGNTILFGYLILNAQSDGAANVTLMSEELLSTVIAHEIGHVLGFGHSSSNAALMYYSLTPRSTPRLSQDDVDAVTYLYPRSEINGTGLMGCGTLQGPGSSSGPGGLALWAGWALVFSGLGFIMKRSNGTPHAGGRNDI